MSVGEYIGRHPLNDTQIVMNSWACSQGDSTWLLIRF